MKAWKWFCLQQHKTRELCDIPEDELKLVLLVCRVFSKIEISARDEIRHVIRPSVAFLRTEMKPNKYPAILTSPLVNNTFIIFFKLAQLKTTQLIFALYK